MKGILEAIKQLFIKKPEDLSWVKSGIEGTPENLAKMDAENKAKQDALNSMNTNVLGSETKSPINADIIKKAIAVYGGQDAPLMNYAGQIADASNKYPLLKDNPMLPVIQAHLETSSARNITRPNNITNWGINYPGNNEAFSKMTPQQVLEKYLSGIGERSDIYKEFRTGKPMTDEELLRFAKKYEPANPSYGPNMIDARNNLNKTLGL